MRPVYTDLPLNRDEWPNLSELDEPHEPPSRLCIILALVFILGALMVKHCMPRGLDEADQAVVLVD